jgi:molybdopterin converting factor small subunit
MDFSFECTTLGDIPDALFAEYDVEDLILDEDRNVIPCSRIAVKGRFLYLLEDMETPIKDGDLIVLIRHYAFAF